MQIPDMNLLVALDALLDEGSVVGAARRMNLSPAAMSRTLGRIRDAIGDPILVRAGRGLVPTPRALALHEQVRALVEQAGLVFRSRDEVDLSTLDRAFNIRTNDLFIALYGAQLLHMMHEQAPHTVLRFVPEGGTDDDAVLRDGRTDLIVSSTIDLGPEIKVQSLFNTIYVGLARQDHPIFDSEITPERFAAYPQISVSRRGRAN
ncbi:MAG: LysR family transcriptional regulator, partial [Pseudomonas sp.]